MMILECVQWVCQGEGGVISASSFLEMPVSIGDCYMSVRFPLYRLFLFYKLRQFTHDCDKSLIFMNEQ